MPTTFVCGVCGEPAAPDSVTPLAPCGRPSCACPDSWPLEAVDGYGVLDADVGVVADAE